MARARPDPKPAARERPQPSSAPAAEWLWLAAILVVTCLAYGRIWSLGYAWDDIADIQLHRYVQGDGTIAAIFTGDTYAGAGRSSGYYRPLVVAANRALRSLGGGSPVPHHAANLLLHLVVCVLLFRLVRERAGATAALIATALFAVHPLNTEIVAANAGLKDLLIAAPFLACLILVPWSRRQTAGGRAAAYAGLVLTSFVGAFSKESFLVVLPVLAVQDAVAAWARRRGSTPPEAPPASSWLAIAAPYACVALPIVLAWVARFAFVAPASIAGVTANVVMNPMQLLPAWYRLLTAGRLALHAAAMILLPRTLSADYSYFTIPVACTPFALDGVLGLFAGVILVALFAVALLRGRVLALALAMVLVPWATVGQFLALTTMMFAERFLYLPLLGVAFSVALLLVAAAALAMRRGIVVPAALGPALLAIAVLGLAVRTFQRTADWRDGPTLLQQTAAAMPRDLNVRPHLASAATVAGRPAEAMEILAPLLDLEDACPYTQGIAARDPLLHLVAGDALTSLNRFDEARQHLKIVVTEQPEALRNWLAYGRSFAVADDLPGAMAVWEEGLSRSTEALESAPAMHSALAGWYYGRGDLEAARRHWDALLVDPRTDAATLKTIAEQARAGGDLERARRAQQRLGAAAPGS